MKISRLWEEHLKHADRGLPGSFGDGYLMVHNRLFRRVRDAALGEGCRFSDARDEAYEAFPLLRLEALLEKKTLPYANNAAAFASLTPVQREALTWDDADGNLKKNFVFHEACHAVVRALAARTLGPLPAGTGLEAERRRVFRWLLEESCANTCELLGMLDAGDALHRIFYETNSYIVMFDSRTHFRQAFAEIGADRVARVMLFSYVLANCLHPRLDERDLATLGLGGLEAKSVKTLRALSKTAFQLSERFRVQTTSFHLRLAGIKTPVQDLLDADVLEILRREPGMEAFLSEFLALFEGL